MATDDRLRDPPPLNGLAEDLDHPGEGLPVEVPGPDNGAAVAIEDEDAREPLAVNLDPIAQVGKPGSCPLSLRIMAKPENQGASLRFTDLGLFARSLETVHYTDPGMTYPSVMRRTPS
jgi:hypothetical protein